MLLQVHVMIMSLSCRAGGWDWRVVGRRRRSQSTATVRRKTRCSIIWLWSGRRPCRTLSSSRRTAVRGDQQDLSRQRVFSQLVSHRNGTHTRMSRRPVPLHSRRGWTTWKPHPPHTGRRRRPVWRGRVRWPRVACNRVGRRRSGASRSVGVEFLDCCWSSTSCGTWCGSWGSSSSSGRLFQFWRLTGEVIVRSLWCWLL